MNKALNELEEAVLEAEGIAGIMGMVSDCAIEGAQSLDNFKTGFWLINMMIEKNTRKLKNIYNKLYAESGKVAK